MRVWIDLGNSPHPLLFEPVAAALERDGHEVAITARDNAQTRELTLERWPEAAVVGGPSPANRAGKAAAIGRRVARLRRWAATERPELALSHNSYAQILAARSLAIRAVTAMDYEHQPVNHLAFRLAHRVVLPEAFPAELAARQGARHGKLRRYAGFKEEIYLGDFEPDPGVARGLGIDATEGRVLVVARTPPSGATYHRFGNPAFEALVDELERRDDCVAVLLPRNAEQGAALRERAAPNLVVPERAVDSRSLIHGADLFVGAGGTMTREAALLGTPTVSLYAGKRPAVEVELERRGALRLAASVAQVGPIARRETEPRTPAELRARAAGALDGFLAAALG